MIDVFQPCVVYNKQNTYQWFKENTYYLDENYDKNDKNKATEVVSDLSHLALGVIYQETGKPHYAERLHLKNEPLFRHKRNDRELQKLMDSYR